MQVSTFNFRLRQRVRSQRILEHLNIPGPGLDAFLRENRASLAAAQRAELRSPSRGRASRIVTPSVVARNQRLSNPRMPQALRLTDRRAPTTERSRTRPIRIRTSVRTNVGFRPTRPTSISGTQTTTRSKPVTSTNINTSPLPKQKSQSTATDMISIDSLLSMIKGLRGQQGSTATAKSLSTPKVPIPNAPIQNLPINPTPTTTFQAPAKPTLQPGGMQRSNALQIGGRNDNGAFLPSFDPSVAMLSQFSLMNRDAGSDGSILSSLLSNPMLLSKFTGRSDIKSVFPMPSSDKKKRGEKKRGKKKRKGAGKKKEQKQSVAQNPFAKSHELVGLTKKLVHTGNPVQDSMINFLLESTLKNMQEDLRETWQKKMADLRETTTASGR